MCWFCCYDALLLRCAACLFRVDVANLSARQTCDTTVMQRNICVRIPAMTLAYGISGADGKVAQRGTISLSESLEAFRSRTAAPESDNGEHQEHQTPLFRKRQARARLLKLNRPERRTLLRSGSSMSIVVLSSLDNSVIKVKIDHKLRFGH